MRLTASPKTFLLHRFMQLLMSGNGGSQRKVVPRSPIVPMTQRYSSLIFVSETRSDSRMRPEELLMRGRVNRYARVDEVATGGWCAAERINASFGNSSLQWWSMTRVLTSFPSMMLGPPRLPWSTIMAYFGSLHFKAIFLRSCSLWTFEPLSTK